MVPDSIKKPVIDYTKLKELCEIDGLRDRKHEETSDEAHEEFMHNYKSIFVQPESKGGFPIHSLLRSKAKGASSILCSKLPEKGTGKTLSETSLKALGNKERTEGTHNIRDYLPLLHRGGRTDKLKVFPGEELKRARKILRKLPFERSAVENEELFAVLKTVPSINKQVPTNVLKELCVVATLDSYKRSDTVVFGNTGWHLILKGAVKSLSDPHHIAIGAIQLWRCLTPEPTDPPTCLQTNDAFGTLMKVGHRLKNTRILTVITTEPYCEFLKISCKSYDRVIRKMKERELAEKVNILQSCKTFTGWSGQALTSVAESIVWTKFPPNTMLVSEGYTAPFIAIIKSGTCHILRQVEVKNKKTDGNVEKKMKQVVMGKLGYSDSFGEISVINKMPINCSIITADAVEVASIDAAKIAGLDNTTKQFLLFSSKPTFDSITQTDIYDEYIKQEEKREWNEFKHNVIVDVINYKGIRPGYGKWAK